MTILFIIFTIISATIDAELYNSGYRFTDHTSRFLLRALVVVMLSNSIVELGFYASLFYLLFDYTLNIMCHRSLLYVGETSWIDKKWKWAKYAQLIFFAVANNNSTYQGSVVSLHIRVATGTGSINVNSGSKMVMIAAGAPLPA